MYKHVIMFEDHTELSPDQIKLVEAFEAAANYFAARIVRDPSLSHLESLESLASRLPEGQTNSFVSEEASKILDQTYGAPLGMIQTLKRAALFEGEYIVEQAARTQSKAKWDALAEQAKSSTLCTLLIENFDKLPKNYVIRRGKSLGCSGFEMF